MAFSGKVWGIIGILAVVLIGTAVLLAIHFSKSSDLSPVSNKSTQGPSGNQGNNETPANPTGNITAGSNGTRFVDVISKIATDNNRNQIQTDLDQHLYAPINIELDDAKSVDSVLSSMSSEEFQLIDISTSISPPKIITGNASESAIKKLESNPRVKKIYYNYKTTSLLQDSVFTINATLAWLLKSDSINITGNNVTVCIVDTGVNYSHPDLGGCPFTNNITSANCSKIIGGASLNGSAEFNNSNPMDYSGHGTHVAGIVGANGNIKGIAPDVKIVMVRIKDNSSGDGNDFEEGIKWCIDHQNSFNPPIKIISSSTGVNVNNPYQGLCDGEDIVVNAANNAVKNHGLLFVQATGDNPDNDSMVSPACGSNITSVAASTKLDGMPDDLNRNSFTDLAAPGIDINSTSWYNGTYLVKHGTSMAAPHVAGVAALLLQVNPDLTPYQIEDILKLTGRKISVATDNPNLNFSRVDAYKAVMAINASLLQLPSVTEIYSNDTRKIYDFRILDANLSHIENISWQAIAENGTAIDSTINFSVSYKQSVIVLFEQNFSKRGIHDINFSARAGNLFYSKNYTAKAGDIFVSEFNDLDTNGLQKTYEFRIATNKTSNITGINWSFDYGDGITPDSANNLTNLTSGREIFVIVRKDYSVFANRILNATVFTASVFAEKIRRTSYLNMSGFNVLNASSRYRIFGFNLTNLHFKNLTGIVWNVTLGDGGYRNATQTMTLRPNETGFALFDYNYSAAGNYTVNVTLTNFSIVDTRNITLEVT